MTRARFRFGEYDVLAIQVLPESYETFNYLFCRKGRAVLVDAGEAKPILNVLEEEQLQLLEILITHNDPDHVGGCRALQDRLGVLAKSPGVESCEFDLLGTRCISFSTPGHFAVSKSFHLPDLGIVFVGDTIIAGGCGRVRNGAYGESFESLQTLKALPDETRIFGGHDYLEENMHFALSVEPGNADMQERLERYRTDPIGAIFVALEEEKKTNPFLRTGSVEEFTRLRELKDRF